MGVGPIPVSVIRIYARDEWELSGDPEERFVSLIRRMDDAFRVATAPKKTGAKGEPDPDKQIPADDVDAMRSNFARAAAASKSKGKERTK